MKLKVCGLTQYENIREIAKKVSPDYAGLIFYKKSPRCVDEEALKEIVAKIPESVQKVGVFVDEEPGVMEEKAAKYKLDYLQLHGNESASICEELNAKGYKIIKAFSITPQFDFDLLQDYMPYVNFFLFDTKGEHQGGNGYSFDWKILNSYDQKIPFFLSGGISLDNIEEVKELLHLNIHAVDVNSKFEISPGLKEVPQLERLRELINDFN